MPISFQVSWPTCVAMKFQASSFLGLHKQETELSGDFPHHKQQEADLKLDLTIFDTKKEKKKQEIETVLWIPGALSACRAVLYGSLLPHTYKPEIQPFKDHFSSLAFFREL